MAQPAGSIVGRTGELAVLDGELDGLADRRARALEIVGEPGIGKSRLLAELGARADARGYLVLSGSASGDLPFWAFVDALDEYVRGVDPRRLRSLDSSRSPSASCRSRGSWSTAARTPRSPPSCSSARRPSRRTCATSSTSSTCSRASMWHGSSSART
jgi:AAA ATPase domain